MRDRALTSDYARELDRLFREIELKQRDAELSEATERRAEETVLGEFLKLLVDKLEYSHEEALAQAKSNRRFPRYFAALD